ncbi:MAG: (2Fe-2S) ferredoxin domain-containing protein [Nocardioides sp.]
MSSERVVLVGLSVREVQARAGLGAAAARAGGPHAAEVAFLQLGDPPLGRALTRLADEGVARIVLVGVSLGPFAPAASWLRRVAAYWWRERGGHRPEVAVAPGLLGDLDDPVAPLVASARPVTGAEPGLTSPVWEEVSRHRHQVLLCRGPRCTALGSDASAEALVLALMDHGLGDEDVLVTHTGCLLPCNQAPVVSVQPDDVWYGGIDPRAARQVVDEHLVGGTPVETRRLPRDRPPLG